MENQFGNQPSTKEIEEIMTEEQKEKSEEREATLSVGHEMIIKKEKEEKENEKRHRIIEDKNEKITKRIENIYDELTKYSFMGVDFDEREPIWLNRWSHLKDVQTLKSVKKTADNIIVIFTNGVEKIIDPCNLLKINFYRFYDKPPHRGPPGYRGPSSSGNVREWGSSITYDAIK